MIRIKNISYLLY
jgi:hypothetical protein